MENKKEIIERLEIMRGHGQLDGTPEEKMDFNKLSDEDLKYYESEWIEGQFED